VRPTETIAVFDDFDCNQRNQVVFRYFRTNGTGGRGDSNSFSAANMAGRKWAHLDGMNALFVDGHVKWLKGQAIVTLLNNEPTQ
jgi:prepilin-type processing-associated H-X9-DG protein